MNKLYYFSKTKLKFVEIRNFTRKFLVLVILSVIIISSLLFGGYFLINSIVNSDSKMSSLRGENNQLSDKLSEMVTLYKKLNTSIDSLSQINNQLRLAANLPPINNDEGKLGTGGGVFDNILNFSKRSSKIDLDELSEFVDHVQNKISFERNNYIEISKKLKSNEQLYSAIPAIKPSSGTYAEHGFGMRYHPILHISRMHEGLDIITDLGTPVLATGNGTVSFMGNKNGLGLCVEIEHGFGYHTVFGHLSASNVRVGQKVSRGEVIAKTGNSGLSSGPHLHYEVHHDGVALDPSGFIFDDLNLFDLTAKK